ncbi:ubiquitin-related domain-containing protein [Halteromyces radiatus]|uniref:ubiquitin-related domain-containing protein n=1 Tax=Halteromyces radiatus TaxID=101107 RepID=UPI00221F7361|nr:ubiquitin-related domain-containing protein [Halteromyces radiatus]KAI8097352.1 ubiquitin-related domain-containing protein [Halteromyces radiatus]
MSGDIDTLVGMGFSRGKVQKAWKAVNGAGLQPAMDWLLSHPDVSDEPEEDQQGQALGSTSTESSTSKEEGEIKDGEQTAQSLICNDCQKLFRDATSAERHAIKTQHQNFSESTEIIKPLTEEEKKQKLAELKARLAEKRAKEAANSIEEQKQAERIRRKAGQDMSALKEEMEAKEIKKAFEAKRREKELDRIAKANIKAKIEQDRLERQAKREASKRSTQETTSTPATTAGTSTVGSNQTIKTEYNEARLQIRIPNATPVTQTFAADAKLTDVYDHLKAAGCNGNFTLSTTFPRKTFADVDLDKSLKELGLTPSSALVLTFV